MASYFSGSYINLNIKTIQNHINDVPYHSVLKSRVCTNREKQASIFFFAYIYVFEQNPLSFNFQLSDIQEILNDWHIFCM